MGSNSGPFVFGAQQGGGGAPVAATTFDATISREDGSFASTNPSFKQQSSRLAVVHAMVQHEQDTAEHRKKARARDRAASKRYSMKKPVWEPIQLQGPSQGSSGTIFGQPAGSGFRSDGQNLSTGQSGSNSLQEDEDDIVSQMNDMDIDETASDSEPELSESATTVSRATSDIFQSGPRSPSVMQSSQYFGPPSSSAQSSPTRSSNAGVSAWRAPVNYLSKPANMKHDQAAPSFPSIPAFPHAPTPFSQPGFHGQQYQSSSSQATPSFAQARPSVPPGRFEIPPVQPLQSPFSTPPARFPPPGQSQRPGSYFAPHPPSQFPPSMPPNAPLPVTFTRFGSQANNSGSYSGTSGLNPLAPEFIPRWKMDGIQRFTGRARPFQRLLEDYQRLQGGQQNKQQELQLQLQLALQLQVNSPQVALQNALQQALQNTGNVPPAPPTPHHGVIQNWQYADSEREAALRDALQRALQNIPPLTPQSNFAQNQNSQPGAIQNHWQNADPEREAALRDALQRALQNVPPVTPQPGVAQSQNWQHPGPQSGQPPQNAHRPGPPFGHPQPPGSFHGFR